MKQPALLLGVAEMDRDHAEIEALLASVASTADAGLSQLLEALARKIEAHFLREEALLARERLPNLECHRAQHAMILAEISAMRRQSLQADASMVRSALTLILPAVMDAHVGSVDRVAADFLAGRMDRDAFDNFRLPLDGKAP